MISVRRLAGPGSAEDVARKQRELHDRTDYQEMTAVAPMPEPPANAAAAGVVTPPAPANAHVWVADPDGGPDLPGVLVGWQRQDGGWRGQVAYVAHDGVAPALVTAWVGAGEMRPVTG